MPPDPAHGLIAASSGTSVTATRRAGRTAAHAFSTPGVYEVRLEVSSGTEHATDTALVTVEEVPVEPGLYVTVRGGCDAAGGADVAVILADGTRPSTPHGRNRCRDASGAFYG